MINKFPQTLIALLLLTVAAAPASASLLYDFVERGSGDLLATIDFATLPTNDPADVLSVTFTPEGQGFFGYGPVYPGTFDSIFGQGF